MRGLKVDFGLTFAKKGGVREKRKGVSLTYTEQGILWGVLSPGLVAHGG